MIKIDMAARIRRMGNATVTVQRLRIIENSKSLVTIATDVRCIIVPQKRYSQLDEDTIYRDKGGETTSYNVYFASTEDVKPGDIINDGTTNLRLLNDVEPYIAGGLIIAPAVIEP